MNKLTTLCYIEKDNKYLMLHRIKKENDINHDKWIGVGGKFEWGESPEECMLREVREETGYTLTSWQYRGIITFVLGEDTVEYMSLFTADGFEGTPIDCNEGVLEWVEKDRISELNLWEGDRIFFRLLTEETPFFSLKLIYNIEGTLKQAVLNGKELELFDILNEDGTKSGIVRERGVAHLDGSLHATVHIWIARPNAESGYDILLQRRSHHKDSSPDCLDISSAGHISTGDDFLPSAMREAKEELGLTLDPGKLKELGFSCCLLSNNQIGRVKSFNDCVGVQFIENAHKPSTRNYKKAMELMHTDRTNTIFIGDQLFTDVYGANRTGIRTILVDPIHPKEEIQIVLKRYLEKIVLHFYKKNRPETSNFGNK